MATVGVSGYLAGFRMKNSEKSGNYAVLDLLQFGDEEKQSELIRILVYEIEIIEGFIKTYRKGEIRSISMVAEIITSSKNIMWICSEIVTLGSPEAKVQGNFNVEVNDIDELEIEGDSIE